MALTSDIVCIIPARGGSKGIPNKNLKDLGGQPLIHWSIKAAQLSGVVERV
ncbi:MAG: cytidylyltransferase domain-containing protein, partial [Planktothrix sp.]